MPSRLPDNEVIELDDLPPAVRGDYGTALGPSMRRNDSLRAWASRYARLVLDRCQGNKREACRSLDISYHTLQSHLALPGSTTLPSQQATTRRNESPPWRADEDEEARLEVETI